MTRPPSSAVMDRPVMAYALDLLKRHGICEIGVTLQYLPDAIMDYFGDGRRTAHGGGPKR